MPEGHSIHRFARLHRALLGGQVIAASSPQGRFSDGARALDGGTLDEVQAHGKHLFYRFHANGLGRRAKSRPTPVGPPLTLHVHLGLYGRFREYRGIASPPTAGTRLALTSDDAELQLSGPTVCELIDPAAEEMLHARLGPDPLRGDDPAPAFEGLRRRSAGIGNVLLDQRVISGIGNVYRAEILFLVGVHPDRPAHAVDRTTFDRLWTLLRTLMADGERRGRIITVQPQDRRAPSSVSPGDEYWYVYKRAGLPCRRCSTPINTWELGGRMVFACPVCQPA